MKAPLFVLTEEERESLEAGLNSANAFVMRHCQILFASVRGQHATSIAQNLGCADETVRRVIQVFNAHGWKALKAKFRRPHRTSAALPMSRPNV